MGDAWSETLILDDRTYDGLKESGMTWIGGLGLLTDGHYGSDNFKMELGARKGTRTVPLFRSVAYCLSIYKKTPHAMHYHLLQSTAG